MGFTNIGGGRGLLIASLAASSLAASILAIVLVAAVPIYLRWLNRHPLFGMIAALPLGLMFGLIGPDLGIDNLFWDGSNRVRAAAGSSLAALFLILGLLSLIRSEDRRVLGDECSRASAAPARFLRWVARRGARPAAEVGSDAGRLRAVAAVIGSPLLLLLLARPMASAVGRLRSPGTDDPRWPIGWSLPIAAAATFLIVDIALRAIPVRRWREWHGWAAVLVPTAALFMLGGFDATAWLVTASMCIGLVFALTALAIFATHGCNLLRIGLVAGLLALMTLTNSNPYKLTYPGLEAYRGGRAVVLATSSDGGWRIDDLAGKMLLGEPVVRRVVAGWKSGTGYLSPEDISQTSRIVDGVLVGHRNNRLALNLRAYCGLMWLDRAKIGESVPVDIDREREIALAAVDAAIAGGDRNAITFFHRGQLLNPAFLPERVWARADGDRAIASYREAIKLDPLLVRARTRMANLLDGMGRPGDADREYRAASDAMYRIARAGLAPEFLTSDVPALPRSVLRQRPEARSPYRRTSLRAPVFEGLKGPPGLDAYARAVDFSRGGERDQAVQAFFEAFRAQPGPFAHAGFIESPSGMLNDYEVLDRWRLARSDDRPVGPAAPRPKLVVVAVSGGGIVAAGWTIRCLTAIEQEFSAFPAHTRIITGASGGMVGAGLYVASLSGPGDARRSPGQLARLRRQIDADCLSPVVRRMILRDLPSIFDPREQAADRGRVLEAAWSANTDGILDARFSALRGGEMEGWRPSLIVSPLLVEDGAQMVISNLDLEALGGINLHFFATFPAARDAMQLGTALRMNAAFPYVTPAVSLPTRPVRRVADAGYVDNYGIRLATAWIRQHKDWLAENTSGVALVQIRAYKLDLPGSSSGPNAASGPGSSSAIATALQPFSSPLEGYSMAKKTAMVSLNDNLVKDLQSDMNRPPTGGASLPTAATDPCEFFRTFVFECKEPVPLSWLLTRPDGLRLDNAVKQPEFRAERGRLIEFLRSSPCDEGGPSP